MIPNDYQDVVSMMLLPLFWKF